MKQAHSHESCYRILNINNNASWDDLRKSYRSLIQKWHPDRYMDDVGKSEANDKLKDLNTAYKVLSDYYKRNNSLPLFTQTVPPSTSSEQKPAAQSKKKVKQSPFKKKIAATKRKNNIQYVFTISLVIVASIILYQNLDSIILSFSTPLEYSKEDSKEDNIDNAKIKKMEKEIKSKYFTYGSSLGEVINVQGAPDYTADNIWYYGNSEVHFKDGHVVKWIRTSSRQLKARDILTDQ